jgi:plasmid stabilization system protein ParE
MPRGDKSSYTDKQKRQAEHIEKSYEARGVPAKKAKKRAWASVNKHDGGGKRSGSGRKSGMAKKKSTKTGRKPNNKTAAS